jgi:outer membrane protein TolC
MWKSGFLFVCCVCACRAEVRTLTLRDAVEIALKQSPDVMLARLDERRAEESVRLARAPFIPRVVMGSGLAYSSGFPMSIEGATPSILQANAVGSVFNLPQNFRIAAAKESRRGAAIDAALRQDEVVYRVADTFLDAEKARKIADVARREVDSLSGVLDSVRARVGEGRELPIEARKAELNLARARYRSQVLDANVHTLENALAALLGFDPADQIRPAAAERAQPPVPESPEAAVKLALDNSKEVRALESKLLTKDFDVRAQRAGRLPRLDLVAQYGLLAQFNNYQQFFKSFQRNNGQLGISFQVPIWSGPAISAAASEAEAEAAQIRIQIRTARSRVAADTRKAFEDLGQAAAAQEVARLDLDVAREQVSVLLAQMQEGRAALRQVEEARTGETDKWIALYDAAANVERARLALLRQAGGLLAALR